jgi:enoyl-CoA hydratase
VSGVSSSVADGVLRVVLDRPEKLNAVNTPMLKELAERLSGGNAEGIRTVLITGAGRAFCSGGDLSGRDTDGAGDAANDVIRAIVNLQKPVIAGVRGAAVGFGCSLALACDLVVASESAFFQLAFTKVGLMPDGGASALVPASVGRQRANRMALLGERISADQALDWGMISHVVAESDLDTELDELVAAVAQGPTVSYQWIKRAIGDVTLSNLDDTFATEIEGQQTLAMTEDHREAIRAFRRREAPKFSGK